MITRNIWIGGSLVLVLAAVLPFFHSLDLQTLYKQKCQMTCIEYDVDKLRTDFWDLLFLRFQFCSLGNVPKCSNPYRLKMDKLGQRCAVFMKNAKNVKEHFEMTFLPEKDIQTPRDWKNEVDFYFVHEHIFLHLDWDSNDSFTLEHRSARFLYYDFLNFRIGHLTDKSTSIDVKSDSSKEFSQELWNIVTLTVIAMNNETDQQKNNETVNVTVQNPYMVSIGTNVFDQKSVILTKGSKYYSWFSTVVCMWSLLIILYFVWKILTSLHGCTDEFADRRARSSGSHQESHVLTRPDLILVGTGDLNLFRSYFYSTLFEGQGIYSAIAFIASFIVWFLSIIAYFELLPELIAIHENVCILMLITCSIYSLSIIPVVVIFLLCFSLIMFTPELLIDMNIEHFSEKGSIFYMLTGYGLSNYQLYVIVLLFSCGVMLIVLFYCNNLLRDLLLNRDLVHVLLWLTWPVHFLVFLTKLVKRFFSLSDTSLHMIWLALVLALFYLGIFVVPQNVGDRTLSYDPRYLHVLSYWLFFPVYFIFRTFCIAYTKTISLAVEAVFTTFFIAYLCNFLLPWLYPSLKLLKEKDLFLYAILTLTLVTHLLKIYREWYDKYDTFLKAVVSYVRNKYKCTENQTELERNEDSISLVYNHTDDSACQHLEENRGHVHDDKYKIKGLLILIKNSNMYVPSDFFFEVIKIPGAPGAIKWVIAKELLTLLLLRLFPAVFIYWLCHVIYLADFENYNLVITAVLGASFVNQYKELFLYRKAPVFDVSGNIALQRQIDKFLGSYNSWCFVKQP